MANSINTNYGANIALQTLNSTSKALATTQNRVSTGLAVSSAKDNGAIFAIATNQRAEMAALGSVKQSVQRGQSLVDVALAAGDTVVAALTEMKSLAVAIEAQGEEETAAKTALEADFAALQTEITSALAGATFDGVNLFSAEELTSIKTSTADDGTYDIGLESLTDLTAVEATSSAVTTAIEGFTANLATLGTQSKSLERQLTFTTKMEDALEAGIGNL
ncbi:hypothetical protein LTR94_027600, partial [Friedmanniomyces endolithicus]